MIASYSKTCLSYLNKVVDQCNNACHHSIGKNSANPDYSALTEKIRRNIYYVFYIEN